MENIIETFEMIDGKVYKLRTKKTEVIPNTDGTWSIYLNGRTQKCYYIDGNFIPKNDESLKIERYKIKEELRLNRLEKIREEKRSKFGYQMKILSEKLMNDDNRWKFAKYYDVISERYLAHSSGKLLDLKYNKLVPINLTNIGYQIVQVSDLATVRTLFLHRIIAFTFIDNPDNKNEVNHKDLDKTNNDVSNLEWCTRQENIDHYKSTLEIDEFKCPHCGKFSKNKTVMHRWHFDNCKSLNNISLF